MDDTTYVVEFLEPEDGFVVWGPFPTVEASEAWAEAPGGPASEGHGWFSIGILPPEWRDQPDVWR